MPRSSTPATAPTPKLDPHKRKARGRDATAPVHVHRHAERAIALIAASHRRHAALIAEARAAIAEGDEDRADRLLDAARRETDRATALGRMSMRNLGKARMWIIAKVRRVADLAIAPRRTLTRSRGAGRPRAQASRSSARSGDSPDDGEPSSSPRARVCVGGAR